MGFKKEAIITIRTHQNYPVGRKEVLAEEIRQMPGVQMVSVDMGTPMAKNHRGTTIRCITTGGSGVEAQFQTGDGHYIPLYGFNLVAGRNLVQSDTMKEFLINETCLRKLGFQRPRDAIGQMLQVGTSDASEPKKGPIVGVLADFHSQSLHDPIAATFITTSKDFSRTISIKLSADRGLPAKDRLSETLKATIGKIERLWKNAYPGEKFEYAFFEDTISKFYAAETRASRIIDIAMAVAIFISCMGLFSLAAFTTQQRIKEIGIRKVLGAGIPGIVYMLSRDYLYGVLLAIVIASPAAYYFMQHWLQDFAYRVHITPWVFALAGASALVIAFATVSSLVVKAAIANPAKILRSE